MVISYTLYTRNPEDIKEVTPYAIEATKAILMDLLAKNKTYYESLFTYEKRSLTAILKMYHQQEEMYRLKTHTCADRILSIFQPHVRAIVRGKAIARTEFGPR